MPLQLSDFLEHEYLDEQVEAIKEIGDHITQLKRVGAGVGEYLYDKETLGGDGNKEKMYGHHDH